MANNAMKGSSQADLETKICTDSQTDLNAASFLSPTLILVTVFLELLWDNAASKKLLI